ncbi:hypothetical protein ACP4OV_031419 [Aristida adscensionis]
MAAMRSVLGRLCRSPGCWAAASTTMGGRGLKILVPTAPRTLLLPSTTTRTPPLRPAVSRHLEGGRPYYTDKATECVSPLRSLLQRQIGRDVVQADHFLHSFSVFLLLASSCWSVTTLWCLNLIQFGSTSTRACMEPSNYNIEEEEDDDDDDEDDKDEV